jgi:hypothetical protein
MSGTDPRIFPVQVTSLEDRVGRAWRAVTAGLVDPFIQGLVLQMANEAGCHDRAHTCKLNVAYHVAHELITYRADPDGFDLFKSLDVARIQRSGDCGTYTVAVDTILAIWGYQVGAMVIAQTENWDHIFGLVKVPRGGVVPLDASVERRGPGWMPPRSTFWANRIYWYDAAAWVRWSLDGKDESRLPQIVPAA